VFRLVCCVLCSAGVTRVPRVTGEPSCKHPGHSHGLRPLLLGMLARLFIVCSPPLRSLAWIEHPVRNPARKTVTHSHQVSEISHSETAPSSHRPIVLSLLTFNRGVMPVNRSFQVSSSHPRVHTAVNFIGFVVFCFPFSVTCAFPILGFYGSFPNIRASSTKPPKPQCQVNS